MSDIYINKDYICRNPNNMSHYADGTLVEIPASMRKYIVIHYTGNAGSTAKNNCEYYANADVGASANYFVDFDGTIYQSVEDNHSAWHVGCDTTRFEYCKPDGVNESSNGYCLGIEMCCKKVDMSTRFDPYQPDWYFEEATIDGTVKLVQYLMEKYNIDIDHVIRHYDANTVHKFCPAIYCGDDVKSVYNKTGNQLWAEFKARVMGKKPSSQTITDPVVKYPAGKAFVGRVVTNKTSVKVSPLLAAKPLTTYPSLGKDNLIEVLGQNLAGAWLYVRIANIYTGWVLAKDIVDSNTGKQNPVVQKINNKTFGANYVGEITRNTDVKITPLLKGDILVAWPSLGKTNLVKVIGYNGNKKWAMIDIQGVKGWVEKSKIKNSK